MMTESIETTVQPVDCHWFQPTDNCWQLRRPSDEPRLDGFTKRNQDVLGEITYDAYFEVYTAVAWLPDGQPMEMYGYDTRIAAAAALFTCLIKAGSIRID